MSHREINLHAEEIASQPLVGEHLAADAIATPEASSATPQSDTSSQGDCTADPGLADSGEETSSLERFGDWIDAQLMILEAEQSRFVTDRSMLKSLRR